MRAPAWFVAVALLGCHPSASVERTMPVANLQTYRTVALRVSAVQQAQGQAYYLESSVLDRLHRQCGFEAVGRATGQPADLVLDLNVTARRPWRQRLDHQLEPRHARHAARPHRRPERRADRLGPHPRPVVADVGQQQQPGAAGRRRRRDDDRRHARQVRLHGPAHREGRTPPPPPNTGSGSADAGQGSAAAPDTEAHRADADKLNDDGKAKFRTADLDGAIALFQQANQLAPDPRYVFNICLAYEAQQQCQQATTSCQQARAMNPKPELPAKIDHRLDLLAHKQ